MSQNKFKTLSSRVMQCEMERRIVRSMRMAAVKCFRCGEKGTSVGNAYYGERKKRK